MAACALICWFKSLNCHQMLLFRALDCAQWNRTVKSHKATLVLYRKRQQIQICKLAMTVDFAVVKRGGVQQAQVS